MKFNKLKKIIKMVEESDIDEIEIKGLFRRVRVTRRLSGPSEEVASQVAPPSGSPPVRRTGALAGGKEAVLGKKKTEEVAPQAEEKFTPIKALMVGTFYRSSSPEADPYVEVGDEVTPGKVVCVIEAMKVMNEIESEVAGVVREILVKNEEPVEYGQELFLIELEK